VSLLQPQEVALSLGKIALHGSFEGFSLLGSDLLVKSKEPLTDLS